MRTRAAKCLDMRSSIRAIALLEASHAFRKLGDGETLEILVSDLYTKECLFRVLPASRYEIVGNAQERSFSRILLKKKIRKGGKEACRLTDPIAEGRFMRDEHRE